MDSLMVSDEPITLAAAAPPPPSSSPPSAPLEQLPESSMFTNKGLPRKRRPAMSKEAKQQLAEQNLRRKIEIAIGRMVSCEPSCTFRCTQKFTTDRRMEILNDYMSMSTMQQKVYILNLCERSSTLKDGHSKRRNIFKYYLFPCKKLTNKMQVCQLFFITTLGFSKSNKNYVYNLLRNTPNNGIPLPKRSGKQEPGNKFRHQQLVIDHINSYGPKYRGKKTPGARRYLPSNLTLRDMHRDFVLANPNLTISYALYRQKVLQQKVVIDKRKALVSSTNSKKISSSPQTKLNKNTKNNNDNNHNDKSEKNLGNSTEDLGPTIYDNCEYERFLSQLD